LQNEAQTSILARAMKHIPLLLVLSLAMPLAAAAQTSAYQALRTIGAARDQALLSRVLEVKGRNGAPQPAKWVVVLDDPLARGGVREIEVAGGKIVSERTPVKQTAGAAGALMDFHKLNLDSSGAFTVAEDLARKAKLGFDSVDYTLRCGDANAAPAWVVELFDAQRRSVGTVSIAADTGVPISNSFGGPRFGDTGARYGIYNLGHRIDRSIHRAGASVEEFFTGKRTWDQRFEGEE